MGTASPLVVLITLLVLADLRLTLLVMLCVVLPTVYHLPGADGQGVHENAIDAAVMVANSGTLAALVGAYWVSISFFNFASLSVTKHLSAVHRTLVDAGADDGRGSFPSTRVFPSDSARVCGRIVEIPSGEDPPSTKQRTSVRNDREGRV